MKLHHTFYFQKRVDPFVQAFLTSDALLYSALNIVTVFFAVYASSQVAGGSLSLATWALSLGYCTRIITELAGGRYISRQREATKIVYIVIGMLLISLAYLMLALTEHATWLYVWWALGGIGWGLALPTKLAVVSVHIDRQQSNQEWAVNDAMNMALIAAATAIGGVAVASIGIRWLMASAALINALGALPYIFFALRGSANK